MKKVYIGFIIISALVSLICFLTTLNLIYTGVVLVIYLLYFFIFASRKFKNYFSLISRVNSCYFFINSFVVTLSVKESFEEAYESATRIEDKKIEEYTSELNQLNIYEKVKYLRSYFNLSIYKLFLNILDIYQDQGGNILNMSDNLISECTKTEKVLTETVNIGHKHIIEFIFLWLLSFGILIFMRYGIAQFYGMMLENPIFIPLIFLLFVICLASIHLFVVGFTNLSIKEDTGS